MKSIKERIKRLFTIFIPVALVFSFCSCSTSDVASSKYSVPDYVSETILSNDDVEQVILSEEVIRQTIAEDVYLKELTIAEDRISQELIQDERIEEVILTYVYYVPEDHLEEYADHSQVEHVFGDNIDLGPLIAKISIGTGIIVTLAVLSVVGLSGPVGSIVASAAPAALQGAATGAAIGTAVGATTGAANGIDESGRTAAVIGFSIAVVGLIISVIGVITAIPSAGTTAGAVALGMKIAFAGMALAGASYATYNMIKTLTTTDAHEIDWDNVDWDKVGVSAAEQAINNGADGYLWGSVLGAVSGGINGGVEYIEEHSAPYSDYNARIKHTPSGEGTGKNKGHWTGKRGESKYVLDEPLKCKNGTTVSDIEYKNGTPSFKQTSVAKTKISKMTDVRSNNFAQANENTATYWSRTKFNGKSSWTPREVENYMNSNNLTWHECSDMHTMYMVPSEVNSTFNHLGGVSEYKYMVSGQSGGIFDV